MVGKTSLLVIAVLLALSSVPAFVVSGVQGWGAVAAVATLHAAWILGKLARTPEKRRLLHCCLALDAVAFAGPVFFVAAANIVGLVGWAHEIVFAG